MSEKKETSIGMYIDDDTIRVGDLVSYHLIDKINKARFEPLPSNKWIVREIKTRYDEVIIRVRHYDFNIIVVSDKIIHFKKEKLI